MLTLHGKQFRNADIIVASPPCQEYSYMAMPWTRAKQIALALRGHGEFPEGHAGSRTIAQLTALFDACFRLQREACEAAGRFIPMVVENVRGARPWVGRSQWNFGSYHLWGDVPALMPIPSRAQKFNPDGTNHGQGSWFAVADSTNRGSSQGIKWGDCNGKVFSERPKGNIAAHREGTKVPSFRFDGNGGSFQSASVKAYGGSFGWDESPLRSGSSNSPSRKAASAQIAKIPFALSSHIARVYRPTDR